MWGHYHFFFPAFKQMFQQKSTTFSKATIGYLWMNDVWSLFSWYWNESILVLFTRYWTTFHSCVQVIALWANDITNFWSLLWLRHWTNLISMRVLYGKVTFADNFPLSLKIFIGKRHKTQLGFNNLYLRWQLTYFKQYCKVLFHNQFIPLLKYHFQMKFLSWYV